MAQAPDDGFTLAEVLIALTVVSLALATIIAASQLVTRHSKQLAGRQQSAEHTDTLTRDLHVKLDAYQPFNVTNFVGNSKSLSYDCDAPARCQFQLSSDRLRLAYVGNGHTLSSWPPKLLKQNPSPRLEALILQDRSGTTLGLVRFEVEQPKDCLFDMISRTCRGEGGTDQP